MSEEEEYMERFRELGRLDDIDEFNRMKQAVREVLQEEGLIPTQGESR